MPRSFVDEIPGQATLSLRLYRAPGCGDVDQVRRVAIRRFTKGNFQYFNDLGFVKKINCTNNRRNITHTVPTEIVVPMLKLGGR